MEQRPPSTPKLAWVKEEEEGPGAAPAQQPGEVEQFQPLQDAAGKDRTQEQDPARGRFRRAAQVPAAIPTGNSWARCHSSAQHGAWSSPWNVPLFPLYVLLPMTCKFSKCIWQEETSDTGTGVMENCDISNTDTNAALLDLLVEKRVSIPEQVPAMVRYIHQWLKSNESGEQDGQRMDNTLLDLTKEYPTDVMITLLRMAPSCDRAAMTMWTTIMSSSRIAELALLTLLEVLGSWPEYSTCTSDGDNTDVFALAATVVMWKILQEPCCPHVVTVYFPHLFLYLLFQVFCSTLDMPEEADTFWKRCQPQHGLATNPNRFAVQTLKALLCQLQYEDVVVAAECKRVWDTLLCADTHHYAVGLLAREMRRASIPLCSRIAFYLLQLLSIEELCWDLPALAFLVEVLECLDLNECGISALMVMSRHLRSGCRQRRRLALRGLMVLSKDLSLAEKMWSLTESLMKLLQENDSDMVRMTITVLSSVFLDNASPIPSPVAPQLAEALLPLFDNDNSQVQLLSMMFFREMMNFLTEKEKKALKSCVCQSLIPLSFHCHDENQHVVEASRKTLHCAARFLKRRDLEQMLQVDQTWRFGEGLLAEDKSRAAKHLHQALPYLDSPQQPLREAAIRFIGMAGRHMRGQKEELRLICEALEDLTNDISLANRILALQTLYILRGIERSPYSIFQKLRNQLWRSRKIQPYLWGRGWLCCWTSVEN